MIHIKVSIIVPVYNAEEYLEKCLDSLVNQSLKDIEIILVNDGSKDNSENIINKYLDKYKNIKYFKNKNEGAAKSRNFGIKNATGDYVLFVDSDDWVDSEITLKLYNKAVQNNSDIVVCGAYKVVDNQNVNLQTFKKYDSDIFKNYILNCSGPCWQLIKRDLIIDNNLYFLENHFYEDIAVVPAYCLFAKKIVYLDENLYYYLIRSGSTMNQKLYNKSLEDIFDSMNNLKQIFIKNNLYRKYYSELEYIFIKHLLHAATLRFLKFNKYNNIDKIVKIIKKEFPNWNKNIYFKKENLKYKIVCNLIYNRRYKLLKILLRG